MAKTTSRQREIIMAKRVARRWVIGVAYPEYRLRVLFGSNQIRNLGNLLQSFRDGRIAMTGVPRVADLGIREDFDGLDLWSRDVDGLRALQAWFEKRGFETTGLW